MAQKERQPKEEGQNRRILMNAMEAYKRPKVDTKDPQAIAQRIEEYLNFCAEKDITPGIMACASWLGVNYVTLLAWHTGTRGSPEHQEVVSKLYSLVENVWEQNMNEGNIDKISSIFYSKAMFGLRDTQEIVVNTTTPDKLPVADLIADSKRLGDAGAIDAEYRLIEDDPYHEKAVDRQQAAKKKHEAAVKNKKEYHKKYFQEHKEEFNERHRTYRQRDAEKAQKDSAPDE